MSQGAKPSTDLSVLVPVYDNAATLDELLDRLVAVMDDVGRDWEVVLVDDGSTDDSAAILARRAQVDPRLRVFRLARNFGGQAASCAAVDRARGSVIVHIDADLENFPEDIPRLLAELDRGHDLVCGYRERREGPWLARRLPSMLFNAFVRSRGGVVIRDVGCGLRAMDAALVRDLASEGEARRLLMPLILRRARRVAEVPVRHRARTGERGHGFLSLAGIAVDYFLVSARRPFLVGGLACAASCALGLAVILAGATVEGLLLAGFGGLGILVSLVGEYVQRLYQLGSGRPFYEFLREE